VPQRQQTADLAAIRASQGDPTSPTYRPPAVVPVQFLSADLAGVRCDFDLVMVVELRAGLIVRFTEYFDTAKLA
jgi:hypothetical protein